MGEMLRCVKPKTRQKTNSNRCVLSIIILIIFYAKTFVLSSRSRDQFFLCHKTTVPLFESLFYIMAANLLLSQFKNSYLVSRQPYFKGNMCLVQPLCPRTLYIKRHYHSNNQNIVTTEICRGVSFILNGVLAGNTVSFYSQAT